MILQSLLLLIERGMFCWNLITRVPKFFFCFCEDLCWTGLVSCAASILLHLSFSLYFPHYFHIGHKLAVYFCWRKLYWIFCNVNGCCRVYDSLFEKKEEETVEKKAKVAITEPPKKDYKRKYFTLLLSLFLYVFCILVLLYRNSNCHHLTLILLVCLNVHMWVYFWLN